MAFDTIDHNILITRLSSWFGIYGPVLNWFKSSLLALSVINAETTYPPVTLCDVVMVGCTWPRDVGGQRAVGVSRGQGSRACSK